MMKYLLLLAAFAASIVGTVVFAQTTVPGSFARPDQARYRLLAEEGIVQPDGRAYVVGPKIWTVADKASGQCYLLFFTGSGTAVSGPIACP